MTWPKGVLPLSLMAPSSLMTPYVTTDWSPFGKKLRSKRPEVQSREKTGTEKAEFQGLKLRKTLSQERQDRPSHTSRTHDFGVKLRVSYLVLLPVCVSCSVHSHVVWFV